MRNYFIYFNPKAEINYLYLFMLYGIASYDKTQRRYDKISYSSKKELVSLLKSSYGESSISYSTINRLLSNPSYNDYFSVNDREILLHNDFSPSSTQNKQFIVITSTEAIFLVNQKDNLLAKYFCYLKYYCSKSLHSGTKQDFTTKQFLRSVGLSPDNHNNYSRISSYNTLLVKNGFLKIRKYRDNSMKIRNVYSFF